MEVLQTIHTRRSVRNYKSCSVNQNQIDQILGAAISAPSGKNRMPWKFRVIIDKTTIEWLAEKTMYSRWLSTAPLCIAVVLDKKASYDYIKDVQSCGAVMQNILLATHGLGLGSCWIGEILGYQEEVMQFLNVARDDYELMGLVAIGYAEDSSVPRLRRRIDDFLI